MASQAFKAKILADPGTRDDIRAAFNIFNQNVRRFEVFLLLIRQKDYITEDENGNEIYRSEEEVKEELRKYLEDLGIEDVKECMELLAAFADRISNYKELKLDSKKISGSMTKFYNAESEAGTTNIGKIADPEPAWVSKYRKEQLSDDVLKEASEWSQSEEGIEAISRILKASGQSSKFKKAYLEGNPEWPKKWILDQDDYRKSLTDGITGLLVGLDKHHAFPLIRYPEVMQKNAPARWIKLFLKTALEKFLGYISSDIKTRAEYEKAVAEYEKIRNDTENKWPVQFATMEKYLKEQYIEANGRSLYLNKRMTRGIEDIKKMWEEQCSTYNQRIALLNELQSDKKKQKYIGDVNLFRWLAMDENQSVIKEDGCLDDLITYYKALHDKELKRKCASFTPADPVTSKRSILYEFGKSNYKQYTLTLGEKGGIIAQFPLLLQEGETYYEKYVKVTLAGHTQFCTIEKLDDNGKVTYRDLKRICEAREDAVPEYERFTGDLGGANVRVETNSVGDSEDIFMTILVKVDSKCTKEFAEIGNAAKFGFATAYDGKKTRYDAVLAGKTVRALSISLGIRNNACAVGVAKVGESMKGLPEYEIERVFALNMPGEKTEKYIMEERWKAMGEVKDLEKEIYFMRTIKKIYNQKDEDARTELLKNSAKYYKDAGKKALFEKCLSEPENTDDILRRAYMERTLSMNRIMDEFRKSTITKKQKRPYAPGETFWAIEYLEELRRLIISWSAFGYTIDDENRLQGGERGVTSTRLLEHISNIRDNRIRTFADMVIQSALGYIYDKELRCWMQLYEPCNMIIFEDLSRYQFELERPKFENSQLMQWSHREILHEVERQAEIYGISIFESCDPAYAGRFYHKTGAPGIRCRRLKKKDFNSGELKDNVAETLPSALYSKRKELRENCLIPDDAGQIFVTLDENDKLVTMSTDMNAACNLIGRVFTRHTHLIRINTVTKNGDLYFRSEAKDKEETGENEETSGEGLAKREKGKYLYNYGTEKLQLVGGNHAMIFRVEPKTKKKEMPPFVDKEKISNIFHDPSGIVLPSDEWRSFKDFWSEVKEKVSEKLAADMI